MIRLMVRDLRLCGAFLWLALALEGLVAFSAVQMEGFWQTEVTPAGLVFMWGLAAADWRPMAQRFVYSLPVDRATVVRARYGSCLLGGVAALLPAGGVAVLHAVQLQAHGGAWPAWLCPEMMLAQLLWSAVLAALFVPVYFRWGFLPAASTTSVAVGGTGPLLQAVVSGAFSGDLSTVLAALADRWGLLALSALSITAGVLILCTSGLLAQHWCRTREY
ncbi:MAG: ABC-2 transporter permease [Candidatus Latescibacterota bacterium]|jgi:hypothetical protein